ncbi:MAG: NAD-dependent protein deacetylase [Pseudomonadales bacterium]
MGCSPAISDLITAQEQLAEFLQRNRPVLALSGAGISTASGIGDYRDLSGAYKRPPPVTIQAFLASAASRQRYWARSMFGWPAFSRATANGAHAALAQLEQRGMVGALITQNVDGLHQQAGHRRVLELHGNLHRVNCLQCGASRERESIQRWLEFANAHLLGQRPQLAPDGDADLSDAELDRVVVPCCERCGGVVKPDVVFFGDSVSAATVAEAYAWIDSHRALLILGSSVMIHSSYRFCRRAQQQGVPMAALNLGRTRADDELQLKIEMPCEQVLPTLLEPTAEPGI